MAYTLDSSKSDCYPDTNVLVNLFNIKDEGDFAEVESVLVSSQMTHWLCAPRCDSFDFNHYLSIHQFLFQDLFSWAGTVRSINLSKKGTRFCPASEIESLATPIFARLKEKDYFRHLPRDEFLTELVDFYCTTNHLHPFREGNGRTQRVFLSQLAQLSDYDLNWLDLEADLLPATIHAANGVTDTLRTILSSALI